MTASMQGGAEDSLCPMNVSDPAQTDRVPTRGESESQFTSKPENSETGLTVSFPNLTLPSSMASSKSQESDPRNASEAPDPCLRTSGQVVNRIIDTTSKQRLTGRFDSLLAGWDLELGQIQTSHSGNGLSASLGVELVEKRKPVAGPKQTKKKDRCQEPQPQPKLHNQTDDTQELAVTSIIRSDYEDPITYQIMADPVTCQDGHTYDRPVIERCFADRIEAEKRRQQQVAGEAQDEADVGGTASCARTRRPLELLSPVTNEVVSGVLVPNFTLEQQIVRLMETNAFKMDSEEIEDWEQRRQEKKIRDQQRLEWKRHDQSQQEDKAEELGESGHNYYNTDVPNRFALEPSLLVRFDPRSKSGLAVPLAQYGSQIPIEYVTRTRSALRCMVGRCAKRLANVEWCGRCARIVCADCLDFEVSNFQSNDRKRHKICVDCITQLVDAMEISPDIRLQQRRVLLLSILETHSARFSNRLALLQEQVLRHESNLRYSPKLKDMECKIDQLEGILAKFKSQSARASARIAAAQSDNSREQPIESIANAIQECEALEKAVLQLQEKQPSGNESEDVIVEYFTSMSSLMQRLEIAQTDLALALSGNADNENFNPAKIDEQVMDSSVHSEVDEDVVDLEQTCYQLECELAALSAGDTTNMDIDVVLKRSLVEAELEKHQIRLTMALSKSSGKSTPMGLAAFETLLQNKTEVQLNADIADVHVDLDSIGDQYEEWPLPHNLKYPTPRMTRELEVLKKTLELGMLESERLVEHEWANLFEQLEDQMEVLEDSIAGAEQDAAKAEANAAEEEHRQRERAEMRRQREQERMEKERILQEKARQAERERQELIQQHQKEEAATKLAFSKAAGANNGGAVTFGGRGDLRMCQRCKAGPIENRACADLQSHNSALTSNQPDSKRYPNHCPNCDWFNANWHAWPYWDGVYGPH